MRRTTLSLFTSLSLVALSATASAASLSPQPKAGLWRTESKALVNGVDMAAQMHQAQKKMLERQLAALPKEERARAKAEWAEEMGEPGVDMQCHSAEKIREFTRPESMREKLMEDMEGCDVKVTNKGKSSLAISGQCDSGSGADFDGKMEGEMEIVNSKEIRFSMNSKGKPKMEGGFAQAQDGMSMPEMKVEMTSVSTWVGSDCGDYVEDAED